MQRNKFIYLIFLVVLFVGLAFTDPYARRIRPFTAVPGACAENEVGYSMTLHNLYICKNTGYVALAVGGSSAPISATYITQTPDGTLTNEQALSALATGVLKNTTTTGVLSIAGVSDVDSILPTQTANNGKYLTTNGTISSWGTVSSGITNSAGINIFPKSDGTNLVTSNLSDNGSSILSSVTISSPNYNSDGTVDGSYYVRASDTTYRARLLASVGLILSSQRFVEWTNATDVFGTADLGLYRNTARVLEINNGTAGILGDLVLRNITIGSGTQITKHLSATTTLDFANLAAIGCEDLTITVTGAALSDTVSIGVPNGSVVANGTFTGWVSAADTVTIRFCTVVSGNPASGTFRADVWQH